MSKVDNATKGLTGRVSHTNAWHFFLTGRNIPPPGQLTKLHSTLVCRIELPSSKPKYTETCSWPQPHLLPRSTASSVLYLLPLLPVVVSSGAVATLAIHRHTK